MNFLATLELKDFLTLAISATALVLSMASFFFTRGRYDYEAKRELRRQLSELIPKINDAIAEVQRIWANKNNINNPEVQARLAELNQKNSMLVRQAAYLMDDRPELVNDVEYLTVATALAGINDYPRAEKYYLLAIATAPNAYYKLINLQGYAGSLFLSGDDVKGRVKYQEALGCLPNTGNFNVWCNAQTHQMWGVSEARNNSLVYAKQQFDRVREVLNGLGNQNAKNRGLAALDQVIASELPPIPS